MSRRSICILGIVGSILLISGLLYCGLSDEVEITDYHDPNRNLDEIPLVDDKLEDKHTRFDPELIHSRKVDGWEINLSDAILRLDCPAVPPDSADEMLVLRPSYREAMRQATHKGWNFLPSLNLIDGKAKQFDDGLYAALDLAHYQGVQGALRGHLDLVLAVYQSLGPESPARSFLAGALRIAGETVNDPAAQGWIDRFEQDAHRSGVAGFYEWSADLRRVHRFLRYLSFDFPPDHSVRRDLARTIRTDASLSASYGKLVEFYSKLTNPPKNLPIDSEEPEPAAFLPLSISAHAVLFERLFPAGLPPNSNLMKELIVAIRSGSVDLRPTGRSGWFDYQVHALEVLVLPERGEENRKLLLTAAYKRRMLEAFQALITKRVETHRRQLFMTLGVEHEEELVPALRIEPCATYYLRTARAYAFLVNFLSAAIGREKLATIRGLRREGPREKDLACELEAMRDLFYGFYILSCEDVGLRPVFLPGEPVESAGCARRALDWLDSMAQDADLAADTRVAVPVYASDRAARMWGTLGVRLALLDVSYARAPQMRLAGTTEWKPPPIATGKIRYVIPVDEFAEFTVSSRQILTRDAFRAVCDREKTKENILRALK